MASAPYASPPSIAPYANSSPSFVPSPAIVIYRDENIGPNVTLSFHKLGSLFTVSADYFTLACFGVFTTLIGYDIWRAFTKRATWLPGKAFALSGVTVQIIVWWTSLSNILDQYDGDIHQLIYNHQLVVSGRVAVCVFVGYLLPGMAAPSVRVFLALAITICAQLSSELFLLRLFKHDRREETIHRRRMTWSMSANLILFLCIIVLGLILCCTILAGKTIQSLLRQRISAFLSITEEGEFQFSKERMVSIHWDDFGDEVLMSWFIARVCQADYVICRSVLSSAVVIVITVCVIVSSMSNTYRNEYFYSDYYPERYKYIPLFSFILIGWLVICWRWLSAQLYFRLHKNSWKKRLCLEDFWTSHTIELIGMYDLKRDRQRFVDGGGDQHRLLDDKKSCSKMLRLSKLENLPAKIFTKVRLQKGLYLMLMIQISVVFFSKVCGLLSEVIVGKFLYWCGKQMRKRDQVEPPDKYARILKCISMPGEDPSDLWQANKMSFNKAKRLMDEDYMRSKSINSHLYCSPQWAKDGTELVSKLKKKALPSVSEYFPSVEKQCLKMTAVSLLSIFIQLDKAKSTPWIKACCEVWDLLTFVEECDIDLQVNKINLLDDFSRVNDQVCIAADREFYKLQMECDKSSPACQDAHGFLCDQLEKCKESLKRENLLNDGKVGGDLNDSKDWAKIAPCYTLYKLCNVMFEEEGSDFVSWTEKSLRNIISCCVAKLPDMLVKQCWKWAQEFEEDKLWEAIHLAGKCKGMMEACGLQPKPTVNTKEQWTIEVEELSKGDQMLSNTGQCTIEVKDSPSRGVSHGTG